MDRQASAVQATGIDAAHPRQLKLGIVGIGVGTTEVLPAMEKRPFVQLVAGADVNRRVLDTFLQRYPGTRGYSSVEELCGDPEVEAVWVATPNRYHCPHAIVAVEHGKHVVVEKPMALNLDEARRMIEASEKHNVKLIAGHTRSFTPAIRTMRQIVRSGEIGKLCAVHIWSYSDWMLRPRTADELDPNQGGGMTYRQGPHQVDVVRLLGGGMLRSVRATVGQWRPERPIPGYYSAHLEFVDGTPATVMHNGYGYFVADELVPWGDDRTRYTQEERVDIRRGLRDRTLDEDARKDAMRIGGAVEEQIFRQTRHVGWRPDDLGIVIVSCERGDIRNSQFGLWVYDDNGRREVPLDESAEHRRGELDELYDAVVFDKPVYHTPRWGMATLEVCLAMMESSRERREILLQHQVPMPDEYV